MQLCGIETFLILGELDVISFLLYFNIIICFCITESKKALLQEMLTRHKSPVLADDVQKVDKSSGKISEIIQVYII